MTKIDKDGTELILITADVPADVVKALDVWRGINLIRSRKQALAYIIKDYLGILPKKEKQDYKPITVSEVRKLM